MILLKESVTYLLVNYKHSKMLITVVHLCFAFVKHIFGIYIYSYFVHINLFFCEYIYIYIYIFCAREFFLVQCELGSRCMHCVFYY